MQISVIIPVYNIDYEKLNRCILSILHQTFSDFEIIIVDDGSPVAIANKIDMLSKLDSRIKVFHRNNEGVSSARNFGVHKSSGKYIMFVDGDDLLAPWAMEQGVYALESTDADIAIGRVLQTGRISEYNNQRRNCKQPIVISTKQGRMELERHIFLKNVGDWGRNENGWMFNLEGCWSHLMKKNVAEAVPFIHGIAIAEDTIWAVELLRSNKNFSLCLVDDLWYYYIQNDMSVLHKYSPKLGEMIGKAIEVLHPLYAGCDKSLYNAYLQWLLSKLRQIIMRGYINTECKLSYSEKKHEINNMFKKDPWEKVLIPQKKAKITYKLKLYLYRKNKMLLILTLRAKLMEVMNR